MLFRQLVKSCNFYHVVPGLLPDFCFVTVTKETNSTRRNLSLQGHLGGLEDVKVFCPLLQQYIKVCH